eukprot:bmy_04690T0
MDSRRAAALLLLLVTDWGRAEGAGGRDEGDQSVTAFAHLPSRMPLYHRRKTVEPATAGCPDPRGTLALPAPGHTETQPESSLPVSAPEVWQKHPGLLEQQRAELPIPEPGCPSALWEEVTCHPLMFACKAHTQKCHVSPPIKLSGF